ncbi:hypothetical protein GCM10020219_092780 [Nonomuraea dietziae]
MNSLLLNTDGVQIPQLGFGVWQVPDDEAERAVSTAIAAGYTSIDTAKLYFNEEGVGRAIAKSGVPREKLFITTKLWNDEHDNAEAAFETSLGKLGLDYLDLYLIHWPVPSQDKYVQAWKTLERLYRDGRIRAIGVSNFTVETLERLMNEAEIVPSINQIELHPHFQQKELRAFHEANGILTEAWSPLGQGKGPARRSGAGQARDEARQVARPGRAALAHPARQRGDPQVRHARADQGEHRRVRFHTRRRGHGRDRRHEHRQAHRS